MNRFRSAPLAVLLSALLSLTACGGGGGGGGGGSNPSSLPQSPPAPEPPQTRSVFLNNLAPITTDQNQPIAGATVKITTLDGTVLAETTSSDGTVETLDSQQDMLANSGLVQAEFELEEGANPLCLVSVDGGRFLDEGDTEIVATANDTAPRAVLPCVALEAGNDSPGPLNIGPLSTPVVDTLELFAPLVDIESTLLDLLDRAADVQPAPQNTAGNGTGAYLQLLSAPKSTNLGDALLANLREELSTLLADTPPRQPNIVMIMADDLGYGDVSSFYPEGIINTPNIDAIAKQGAALTNFRVYPVCSSSRSGWLSGRFVQQMLLPGTGGPSNAGIPRYARIVPEFLRQLGYETALFGKWHLSFRDGFRPHQRGFQTFKGFYGGATGYKLDSLSEFFTTFWFDGDTRWVPESGHTTDIFADEAIAWIQQPRDVPFFLMLSFNAPHTPLFTEGNPRYSSLEEWRDPLDAADFASETQRDYVALVRHMDQRIGDVLAAIEAMGQGDNTLVMITSDNGADTSISFDPSMPVGSNGPFRGGKASAFEGGIRVPLVVHWPGVIPAGQRIDEFTMLVDLWPTLREAAGFPVQAHETRAPFRGASLMPLLTATEQSLPQELDRTAYLGFSFFSTSVIRYPWKYVQDEFEFLFNLADDPSESTPLNDVEPTILQELIEAQERFIQSRNL